MAMFNGTIEEFEKYIGPRIRNRINTIAKDERNKRNGICDICKNVAELQSAHIHGKERKKIINEVLSKYQTDMTVLIDIGSIEEEIISKHYPISETFKFLCHTCHRKYDNKNLQNIENRNILNKNKVKNSQKEDAIRKEIEKVKTRVPKWLKNKEQINTRILLNYFKLLRKNEKVLYNDLKNECMKIPTFETNYDQMKNFGEKNHAKVFEENNYEIHLWEPVKKYIIDEYNAQQ